VIFNGFMTAQTAAHGLNASVSLHQAQLHRVHHPNSALFENALVAWEEIDDMQRRGGKNCKPRFWESAWSQEISELFSFTLLTRPSKVPQQQQQDETTEGRLKEWVKVSYLSRNK
jgi:hypothetical protein